MSPAGKYRLFVALELPDAVRARVAVWQESELGDPALRPVRAEALHFTLAFLGSRPKSEIEVITAALPRGLSAPRMRLLPEPVAIPRGRHPRLFALEAESEGAVALQERVAGSLAAGGFYEAEDRPFWPHLTVARVRASVVKRPPRPFCGDGEQVFDAVRLHLYLSNLRPQGSEYVSLASLELNPEP